MNIKKMDIVCEYGRPPFRAIVLHGGPGAPGCAAGLCRGAAERGIPVLEHLQTADTFVGLMEEILSIMKRYSMEQTILIGHSFGSWLAWCFAEKYGTENYFGRRRAPGSKIPAGYYQNT